MCAFGYRPWAWLLFGYRPQGWLLHRLAAENIPENMLGPRGWGIGDDGLVRFGNKSESCWKACSHLEPSLQCGTNPTSCSPAASERPVTQSPCTFYYYLFLTPALLASHRASSWAHWPKKLTSVVLFWCLGRFHSQKYVLKTFTSVAQLSDTTPDPAPRILLNTVCSGLFNGSIP